MTAVERLRAAMVELQAAVVDLPTIPPQESLSFEEAKAYLTDSQGECLAMAYATLSTIDAIHVLRQRIPWLDAAFRKAGIVTKRTNAIKFPGGAQ